MPWRLKALCIYTENFGLELISSMGLDISKDIQSVKSGWSDSIQSLKAQWQIWDILQGVSSLGV